MCPPPSPSPTLHHTLPHTVLMPSLPRCMWIKLRSKYTSGILCTHSDAVSTNYFSLIVKDLESKFKLKCYVKVLPGTLLASLVEWQNASFLQRMFLIPGIRLTCEKSERRWPFVCQSLSFIHILKLSFLLNCLHLSILLLIIYVLNFKTFPDIVVSFYQLLLTADHLQVVWSCSWLHIKSVVRMITCCNGSSLVACLIFKCSTKMTKTNLF